MKKIISAILITILISACSFGKKDDAEKAIVDDNSWTINTTTNNKDNVTNTEKNTSATGEVIPATENNTKPKEVSPTVGTSTGKTSATDEKLVDDAIKEIDKIINEIEADVK